MSGNRDTYLRQQNILDLLFGKDDGLRRVQIAHAIGVDKSTTTRDCQRLLEEGRIVEGTDRTLKLVMERYRFDVRLSVDEMQALTLACRSLALNLKWNLPYASQALRKLAACQTKAFPVLSGQILETARVLDQEPEVAKLADYVSTLSRAIEKRTQVVIRYPSSSGEMKSYRLLPGRLEPYASGKSLYLYGLEPEKNQLRVLKVERFRTLGATKTTGSELEVERLNELLAPERFKYSWGIWVSDKAPQKVTLLFSSAVASRVRETRWHPTQETQDSKTGDGSVLWSAWISEPLEMLSWVRGWGPDCQILEGRFDEHNRTGSVR